MEYIQGSKAPECIFHNKTKHCITYLNLAQLFPVLISDPKMYTLCSILLHYAMSVSFFKPWTRSDWRKGFYKQEFLLDFFRNYH